jgi:uncharacterized protein involved in exopolysaccharide biosynthesis
VEPQLLPSLYVHPLVSEHLDDRVNVLLQRVTSRDHLKGLVTSLGLVEKGRDAETAMEEIRANIAVTPAFPGSASSQANLLRKQLAAPTHDAPGYSISYTAQKPREAQQVCEAITSMLLSENVQRREQTAETTTDFLARRLEEAKVNLDTLDEKLAEFEKRHLGRLPADADYNLKILAGLNSQLDANTQMLGRAQQDKSFAETLLSQESDALKASRVSPNLPSLREQLVQLQNQLVELQSRYTDDHPDVQKTKHDIAQAEQALKSLGDKADSVESAPSDPEKTEPDGILRLRRQVHDDESAIGRAMTEQAHIKESIGTYQQRLALSPDVEEEYKQLTRDNETAHLLYDSLLQDKSKAEMQAEMEREQQGEQLKLLEGANFPESASFPILWMFAVGGLAFGLFVGIGLALLVDLRDKSLRNERDVMASLDLPMLASLPWVPYREQKRNRRVDSLIALDLCQRNK